MPPRDTYLPFGKPSITDAEIQAVGDVLRSGWLGMGRQTILFEEELAAYVGAPHVIAVNSCTSALFLALKVHGIGEGDEVVCPSLTWCSTANAALYLGATPILCDVDRKTMCAEVEQILPHVTERTRAVVVVHYGGRAVDVARLRKALPDRVAIVEDAAHALAARYADGRRVGSSGNPTCFSFYANKNLSTGDGGAIAVRDPEMADRLRRLRMQGLPVDAWKRYQAPNSLLMSEVQELGYKMNYTDLQASLGRVQLQRLPEMQEVRAALAREYVEGSSAMPVPVEIQEGVLDPAHALHLFVIRVPVERMTMTRDDVILALRQRNVGAAIHYTPLHRMGFYAPNARTDLPVCDELARGLVTLPISASMDRDDARFVLEELAGVLARGCRDV